MSRARRWGKGAAVESVPIDGMARLALRDQGEATVATISGEVDVSNAEELARALTRLPNVASGLIIDLSPTIYLDSAAISLLHELAGRLDRRSQRLILVCPRDAPCRRVLELTGLGIRSPLVEELPAAFAELDGAR